MYVSPTRVIWRSIASTGFGLTAICIGEKRGYIFRSEAEQRVLNTLRYLSRKLPNHRGFFYHWANINTGERLWQSEVSSVDTAILLCGISPAGSISSIPKSTNWLRNFQSRGLAMAIRRHSHFASRLDS